MTKAEASAKKRPKKRNKTCGSSVDGKMRKNCWSQEEDEKLLQILSEYDIEKEGKIKWTSIATHLKNRNSKQVRERWLNHLRPDLRKGEWSDEEEKVLFELQCELGNKWKMISQILQRSDNEVKNRWNSKGYAHHRKILSIGNLSATKSMLNDCALDMTSAERAARAASLRLIEGIPSAILAPFERPADDAPAMMSVTMGTRKESNIFKPRFPGDFMESEQAADSPDFTAKHSSNETDPTDDRENDGGFHCMVALERLPCQPQAAIERSVSWAAGITLLERYDSAFGIPEPGPSWLALPSPNRASLPTSTSYCSFERVHYLGPAPIYPIGETPNARVSPSKVNNSCITQTRNFRGRTFFSPGLDEDTDGITSPFGTTYCV